MNDDFSIGVLGPLTVHSGRRIAVPGAPRLRTLLAVLAVSAGTPVSVDRLTIALWGEAVPANPRRTLQTYAARLRADCAAPVVRHASGFLLDTPPDRVDALRFLRILASTSAAPDERERLGTALALWRGEPFEDLSCAWLEENEAPRLHEARLTAVERRTDLDLAANPHAPDLAELTTLAARHPLRETLWARLLAALAAAGRPAEALDHYAAVRARLAEELGTEPGPELAAVHARLLAGDDAGGPDPRARHRPGPVPHQLPAGPGPLVGRDDALRDLDAAAGNPAAVAVLTGTAGVGKTSLAVDWARRNAARYPDGRLFVDLRGFDPAGRPMTAAAALRDLLTALGEPPPPSHRSPQDLAGRYRGAMADRRAVVVIDNARDAEHARMLLPAGDATMAVVTSRDRLSGLAVTHNAHQIPLGVLTRDDARRLLTARLGGRTRRESAATDAIIDACAGLPLALAVAATRAAGSPARTLADLARDLHAGARLDAFATGEAATDVRHVFGTSYRALGAPARRAFRLLALNPGPDLAEETAAALTGAGPRDTKAVLGELVAAHLLTEHGASRYAFHDLLKLYARELAERHDPGADRAAAVRRLFGHCTRGAVAADALLYPMRRPIALDDLDGDAPPPSAVADRESAHAWLTAELANLLAVVRSAGPGHDAYVWRLASGLGTHLDRSGRWTDWFDVQRRGLRAARRRADPAAAARLELGAGAAAARLRRFDDAHHHLGHALAFFTERGDDRGMANAYQSSAAVYGQQGRPREARTESRRALHHYRAVGDTAGTARSLNAVGWYAALLGDYREALEDCEAALPLLRETGDEHAEAETWDSLGYVHHRLGDHVAALDCYRRALALHTRLGNAYQRATVLLHTADAQRVTGDVSGERDSLAGALAVLERLRHGDAEAVRARLAAMPAASSQASPGARARRDGSGPTPLPS